MTFTTAQEINSVSNFTIQLVKDWKPDVAFITGDLALEKVAIEYERQRMQNSSIPQIPFVFCGVYQNIVESNYTSGMFPTPGNSGAISGIILEEPFQEKINLALSLMPNATKIAFVLDNSMDAKYHSENLRKMVDASKLKTNGLAIEIFRVSTFTLFQKEITTLQNSGNYAIVVMSASNLLDDSGLDNVYPHIITNWVLANVSVRVVGPINQGFSIDIRIGPNTT